MYGENKEMLLLLHGIELQFHYNQLHLFHLILLLFHFMTTLDHLSHFNGKGLSVFFCPSIFSFHHFNFGLK